MNGFMRGCHMLAAVPKWMPDSSSSLTLTMGIGAPDPLCTGIGLEVRMGLIHHLRWRTPDASRWRRESSGDGFRPDTRPVGGRHATNPARTVNRRLERLAGAA